MANETATIQSLKAVDAWIDVINSNISGGVRTAYKTSKLNFVGSNANVVNTGNSSSLPLQYPEPSLVAGNTVIDFSQGAITQTTENDNLAVQGTGWFTVIDPAHVSTSASGSLGTVTITTNASTKVFLTRDGEFHTNQFGELVNNDGYYLVVADTNTTAGQFTAANFRVVYNNMDATALGGKNMIKLTDFISNTAFSLATYADGATGVGATGAKLNSTQKVVLGEQSLKYTQLGSTVFDMGFISTGAVSAQVKVQGATTSDNTILNKSLESSNSSMTQSVPELSLAQKLFSALTKVIQTHQTNEDSVINLIR